MEYFRRYLQAHGEPDGFPRLENDLVFYLEVQKFKVRNSRHCCENKERGNAKYVSIIDYDG